MARASVVAKSQKNQEAAARVRAATIGAGEPIVTKENYKVELSKAFTYYHTYEDDKNFRKWVQKYVGKDSEKLKKISSTKDFDLVHLAILIRLHERDQYLDASDFSKINTKLEAIFNRIDEAADEESSKPKKVSVVLSVAQKIDALATDHIGNIECEVDKFIITGSNSDFSIKSYIQSNQISPQVSKIIGSWFSKQLPELKEALLSKDLDSKKLSKETEQIIEGYSYMSKPKLKKFVAFVESIVAECVQQKVVIVRKPRKVKQKSPTDLVKNIKFTKEYPELKLVGLHPTKLIGVNEAWLYDTKYKKAICLKSIDSTGLSVKGSTIIGFNTSSSECRIIRKPEDWFKTKQSKRDLSVAWKSLTTKVSIPTGRMNENIIIVSVF